MDDGRQTRVSWNKSDPLGEEGRKREEKEVKKLYAW
jgi:hypothetical protein